MIGLGDVTSRLLQGHDLCPSPKALDPPAPFPRPTLSRKNTWATLRSHVDDSSTATRFISEFLSSSSSDSGTEASPWPTKVTDAVEVATSANG